MEQEKYNATLDNCRFCPMCRQVCPAVLATRREAASPRGLALDMFAVARGLYPAGPETHKHLIADCTLCGACYESCVTQQDLPELVLATRERLAAAGAVCAEAAATRRSVLETGQPFGAEWSGRRCQTTAKGPKAAVVFFPGCSALYKAHEAVTATTALLEGAKVEYTYVDGDCCGAPLKELGFAADYAAHSRELAAKVKAAGAATVVTACATCAYWLGLAFKGQGVTVLTVTDFLAGLVREGKLTLKSRTGKSVRVQNPCRMARSVGRVDPTTGLLRHTEGLRVDMYNAEKLVAAGLQVPESLCCGGCGGTRFVAEETADAIAAYQLEQMAKNTVEAEVIVTSCATCKEKLGKAARDGKLEVAFVAELLAVKE